METVNDHTPPQKRGLFLAADRSVRETAIAALRHAVRKLKRHWRSNPGLRDYAYDFARFSRWSTAATPPLDGVQYDAEITKHYHRLEKGLALRDARPLFGDWSIHWLSTHLPRAEARFGPTAAIAAARGALQAYVRRHEELGIDGALIDIARTTAKTGAVSESAGTIETSRTEIHDASRIDFPQFATHRHSIRNFTGEAVDPRVIERAVRVAMKSPCVCNRESRRVYVAYDAAVCARMLSFQNGNRGFGDQAGAVLAVCCDLRSFTDYGERNQAWIDGGLFAMSLNYALHAEGLGVCMLNWSVQRDRDVAFRKAIAVPEHDVVIMLMAVGVIAEHLTVAASPRPDTDVVLKLARERE